MSFTHTHTHTVCMHINTKHTHTFTYFSHPYFIVTHDFKHFKFIFYKKKNLCVNLWFFLFINFVFLISSRRSFWFLTFAITSVWVGVSVCSLGWLEMLANEMAAKSDELWWCTHMLFLLLFFLYYNVKMYELFLMHFTSTTRKSKPRYNATSYFYTHTFVLN